MAPQLSFADEAYLLDLVNDGVAIVDAFGVVQWINRQGREFLAVQGAAQCAPLRDRFIQADRIDDMLASGDHSANTGTATAAATGTDFLLTIHPPLQPGSDTVAIFRPLHCAVMGFDRTISFATRDPVTQLLNRYTYEEIVAEKQIDGKPFGIICAEIDQFAAVNETLGHNQGDQLLQAVASRLRRVLPKNAPFARLYGGRFAVVISSDALDEDLSQYAGKMHAAVQPLVSFAGWQRPTTLSIGVATWPQDDLNNEDVVSASEVALLESRRRRRGGVCLFRPSMLAERRERLALEADLRLALDRGEFALHYQPKVSWPDRAVHGFEALLRWTHPKHGAVSPVRFIPIAEDSGFIIRLGQWVIEETCRQLSEWRSSGKELKPVAVNMSPQQILIQSVEEILEPLARYDIPRDLLEIEITETDLMEKLEHAGQAIESLRSAGFHLAIDDFGTGYSSLGSLRKLPIGTLKIDRSFITDLETSKQARDIASTIMAMAQALSLKVVAEGVETEAQAILLENAGITPLMQGFLFAQAMPGDEAAKLLSPLGLD